MPRIVNPNDIVAAWQQERATTLESRDARRQMLALRPELARLIVEQHAQLASPGRNGQFSAWLREVHIGHRMAYRLLAHYASANDPHVVAAKACVANELNYDSENDPDPRRRPVLILKTSLIGLRFTPLQGAIMHTRLDASLYDPIYWRGSRTPCNVADTIALALIRAVNDQALKNELLTIWNMPAHEIPPLPPFLSRIILRPAM